MGVTNHREQPTLTYIRIRRILLALMILCCCIHQVDFSYFLSSYLSIYSLRVFNIIIKSRFKKRLFLYYVQFVSQVKKELESSVGHIGLRLVLAPI